MSVPVFKTRPDSSDDVVIMSAGFLGRGGRGGVTIEDASLVMSELQEKDAHGRLVLDEDGNPKPLRGQKLMEAAREFAKARDLVVTQVSEEKLAGFPEELGSPPDRPPAREVSLEAGRAETAEAELAAERTAVLLEGDRTSGLAGPSSDVPNQREARTAEAEKAEGGDK